MTKNRLIIIISILVIVTLRVYLYWYIQPKNPVEAVIEADTINNSEELRFGSLIKQIDITSDESLVFFFKNNRNIYCAVVKKKILGYKVLKVSGGLEREKDTLRVGLHGSAYDEYKKSLYFGIIYDDAVERVIWDDIELNKFSAMNMELLYALEDGELVSGMYYLYDSKGNELEHWR